MHAGFSLHVLQAGCIQRKLVCIKQSSKMRDMVLSGKYIIYIIVTPKSAAASFQGNAWHIMLVRDAIVALARRRYEFFGCIVDAILCRQTNRQFGSPPPMACTLIRGDSENISKS